MPETGASWPWNSGIAAASLDDLVAHVIAEAGLGRGDHILTLNLDIYRLMRSLPPEDRNALIASFTRIVADGTPILWAARLAGQSVPSRLTGADLLPKLTEAAIATGLHVHFSGGPPGAADRAMRLLSPPTPVSGKISTSTYRLPQRSWDSGYESAAAEILALEPDVVFAAYGFPKQDYLAAAIRRRSTSVSVIGCGAALEFAAGMTPRAPKVMGTLGLEWLFRMMREPKRLGRRYLIADLPALPTLLVSALRARVVGASTRPA